MRVPLGTIDIPELRQLPAEQRDSMVAECARDMNASGRGTLPFRVGAVLTTIVVVPLVLARNASITVCLVAGLAAMLVGVVAGLPVMLLKQRRYLERLIRKRLQRDT